MSRIYYGWYLVAALFVMLTVASGLAFYNLSVYMNALVATHGFPVSSVSVATALFFIASGIAGVAAGQLIHRFDPRWCIVLGGVLGAVALWAIGRVNTLNQLYLVYAFFGAGHAFAALVPATTLVTRWFDKQRALALSVASTGLSVGGVALTPLSASLIDALGLSVAMPRLALLWLFGIVPLTLLVVRDRPVAGSAGAGEAAVSQQGWAANEALRSRLFLLLTGAWVMAMLAQVGGIAHLFNLVATRVSSSTGATAVSLMALASIVGRFAGGWLLLYVDTRRFALVCFLGQTMAMLALASFMNAPWLLVSAVLFGLTVGNLLMLQPLILAEVFGVRDYGRIFSVSQLITTVGVAAGPLIMGVLYDWLDGYHASFAAAALASAIGMSLVGLARPQPLVPGAAGQSATN